MNTEKEEKNRREVRGGGNRGSREICIISRSEKNLKSHHLDSRQLHRKNRRIKNFKLNQTPKSS